MERKIYPNSDTEDFQISYTKAAAGVGCGIYLFDLEEWEKSKGD